MIKTKVIMDYMLQCPQIQELNAIFGDASDAKQSIIPVSNDFVVSTDVLGNKKKYYDFAINCYYDTTDMPYVQGYANDNLEAINKVQEIIAWIEQQNRDKNFPCFGEDCVVESIQPLANLPDIAGYDNGLVKYMAQVRITYIEFDN